jgi:N-dimethylarginine dimethylaminohydrolase
MCPARHYGVLYEINPWMHREVAASPERSMQQWEALVAALGELGASVETIDPVDGLPDMVFTANAGLVWGDRFVPSRFRHRERAGEEPRYKLWFAHRGWSLLPLEGSPYFEGAGDALPFRDRIIAGYRIRSEFDAHTALAKALDVEVLSVELVDPRFYHLDLTFCPLDDRRALVVPEAWDAYGREVVRAAVPEPIELTRDEALSFCANSVVVGRTVVMPACSPRLEAALAGAGFAVRVCPVDEFLKAGGGVRCLTLALDMGGGSGGV